MSRQRGFTLIEVMVSMLIMSFVLTFAFQAYRGIQTAHERVTSGIDRSRVAGVLLDRMERELVGSIMVQREDGDDPLLHRYVFVSADATLNQEGSDSVRFITQTPTRMSGSAASPGIVMVTYGVESTSDDVHDLVRVEEAVPPQMRDDIVLDDGQVVAEDLAAFRLRFQSETSGWVDSWNSTGVSALDDLPSVVEIMVKLWDRDEEGLLVEGKEHTRQVRLRVRPFRLVADDPNGELEENPCENGTSVDECFAALNEELQYYKDDIEYLRELRDEVTEACFNEPEPSAALENLRAELFDRFENLVTQRCP